MTMVIGFPGAVGAGTWTFFTPENLQRGDSYNYASAFLDSLAEHTQSASSFGFAIPADATITSFTVQGEYCFRLAETGSERFLTLSAYYGGVYYGSPARVELAANEDASAWTIVEGTATTNLPTVAQLNSPDFAVIANAYRHAGSNTYAYLNYIALTVEYDEYVPPEPIDLPTVQTAGVTGITPNWASSGGVVTAEGSSAVTAKGIVWGAGGATLENCDGAVSSGGGIGSYISVAAPLVESKGYMVYAFATNASGTSYGAGIYFETPRGTPTVQTAGLTGITGYWASSGGVVTSEGWAAVSAKGIVWGGGGATRETAEGEVVSGGGTGSYISVAAPLTPGRGYMVYAFAVNSYGVAYGDGIYLVTQSPPTVVTAEITAITPFAATGGGNVVWRGDASVTDRGIFWGTSPNPRTRGVGGSGGEGAFTNYLTDLLPGTRYYVVAWATNFIGNPATGYGADVTFVTHALPTVATAGVYDIDATTATSGGNVASDGGEAVSARGVCWSVGENPTTAANLIPAMTSNTAPSGVASESGHYSTYAAWMAFDHTNPVAGARSWLPSTGTTGWIGYQFPASHTITRYAITSIDNGPTPYSPKTWTFKGSTNGTTWVTLDTRTNIADWAALSNMRKVFDFANSTAYAYYRLDITASNDATYVGVGELEMMAAADDTLDGSGLGAFASYLTGLTEGATYNVRAYAWNAAGIAYGAAVVFTAIANAPPVEPPPGPPRDPSRNLLLDGTLELMVGTLDVAGSATQVRYSNSNPGGFGNLSFRLPADAPWGAFDAQVVKDAAVTMKHGLVGFAAILFEGEITSDVSHATIAGGKAYYDVTCAGLWWKAGQRKDFSMVVGDDDYGQWYAMDSNAKSFNVSTDGCLDIRLEAGQSAAAGDSASLYYWLGKGMGDPAASIDFLLSLLGLNVVGTNWAASVQSAPTPWGPWTACAGWANGGATGLPQCISTLGNNPQALRLQLSTSSAVDALAEDRFIRLDKVAVGSGISANGLSNVSVTANIIPTMTSNTAPSGVASTSGCLSTSYAAWMVFDHLNGAGGINAWFAPAGTTGWLQYRFPAAHVVTQYAVTSVNNGTLPRAPKTWTFKGSNNGTTWVTLDTQTNVTDWATSSNVRKTFAITNSTAYVYYRLDITASNDAAYVGVGELEMMEATVVTATSAHGLKTGDRVFITQSAPSTPTISGWRTVTVTDGVHFTVPVAVTTAGGAGTFYKATRIDQALVEIAVTTGLASLASLQPGGIGNLNWGLVVRPHASRAGSIDLLAATNVAPFDYGFWDNKTFYCQDRPLAIRALHDYLIDSSLPGIDFDVRRATEDSPTVVKVLYKFRAEVGETSPYPDGTALAVYRSATTQPEWSDASPVLDVWNEWADLSLTTAQAGDLGDQILAWLSANAYQGGGTIAPATLPLRAEGTKPVAYIRAGDYIEDSNLDTGPLMITGFSMDADRGIATLGIGENRRAFVERLTPDKA